MGREDNREPFLQNLGRANMRGLRKCKKCGTLNGTRGFSCKNKSCDVVFKEGGELKKNSAEACRLITGDSSQIYSVRVRDKGPDYRGFVQLFHSEQNVEGSSDFSVILNSDTFSYCVIDTLPHCYVECCKKLKKEKFLDSDLQKNAICMHIQASYNCFKDATAYTMRNSVLNSLPISQEDKSNIWQLATERMGPLVQRVSKSMMVVKCKVDSTHPLGFLHFGFVQNRKNEESECKYFCSCRTFKGLWNKTNNFRSCIHFFACIVAFASDKELSQEFAFYINLLYKNLGSLIIFPKTAESQDECEDNNDLCDLQTTGESDKNTDISHSYFILKEGEDGCEVEVEVLSNNEHILGIPLEHECVDEVKNENNVKLQFHATDKVQLKAANGSTISIQDSPKSVTKRKHQDSVMQASSASLTLHDHRKNSCKKKAFGSALRKTRSYIDETDVKLTFASWLNSAIERINKTMHCGCSGQPPPLTFYIPKDFFECLLERMSLNSQKRKIPVNVERIERKDANPFGKFTRYTWHLITIEEVTSVFSTTSKSLKTSQSFMVNPDGSYEPFDYRMNEGAVFLPKTQGPQLRPNELKTVLSVGSFIPSPFIIEWIPDILPESEFGEMQIKFEFYYEQNGRFIGQRLESVSSGEKTIRLVSHAKNKTLTIAPKPIVKQQVFKTIEKGDNFISLPFSTELPDSITAVLSL